MPKHYTPINIGMGEAIETLTNIATRFCLALTGRRMVKTVNHGATEDTEKNWGNHKPHQVLRFLERNDAHDLLDFGRIIAVDITRDLARPYSKSTQAGNPSYEKTQHNKPSNIV